MAPEQASGQATDQRADIWAFGVVRYEMLSGLPLFTGESVPHILADVLKTEPDWNRLPKAQHPRLEQMLERCLEKKVRDRYHSIADARVDIERALSDPQGLTTSVTSATQGSSQSLGARWRTVAGAAVLAAWLAWPSPPPPPPPPEPEPVVRFSVPLPAEQSFTATLQSVIALSPDGTRIAYVANRQIYLRNLDEPEARPVQGTAESGIGAAAPAFSPDGQWLTYLHVVTPVGPFVVKRVPISGGASVTIHEATMSGS